MDTKSFRIGIAYGTRPELIKLLPVYRQLLDSNYQVDMIFTGQHQQLINDVDFDDHTYTFELQYKSLNNTLSQLFLNFDTLFSQQHYDFLFVQGDTASAFAGALSAFNAGIPVGHVEAGLRTWNLLSPFPEEANRQLIARVASRHYAVSEISKQNLSKEGIDQTCIKIVGNTLSETVCNINESLEISNTYLLTLHRRENSKHNVDNLVSALLCFFDLNKSKKLSIILHPNKMLSSKISELKQLQNVTCYDSLPRNQFLNLLNQTEFVITDSGGVQEECFLLNKKMFIARDQTERPEVLSGNAKFLNGSLNQLLNILNEDFKKTDYDVSVIKNEHGSSHLIVKDMEIFLNGKCDHPGIQ